MDGVTLNDDSLVQAIDELINHVHETFKIFLKTKTEPLVEPINNLLEVWCRFACQVVQTPDRLIHAQQSYWQDYLLLCQGLQLQLANYDKLLNAKLPYHLSQHEEHKTKIFLGFFEKYHFLLFQHLHLVIKDLFTQDEGFQKVAFYNNYIARALSLTDFVNKNRDVFHKPLVGDALS